MKEIEIIIGDIRTSFCDKMIIMLTFSMFITLVYGFICKKKKKSDFVKCFFFVLYIFFLVRITLLERTRRISAFDNVFGEWELIDKSGNLVIRPIENIILFIPLAGLVFCNNRKKLFKDKITFQNLVRKSFALGMSVSLLIEVCQSLFKVGTFQTSDLCYNTLGTVIGAIVYYVFVKIIERNNTRKGEL